MNTNIVASSDCHTQGPKKTLDSHGRTTGPARRSSKGQWTAQEDDMLCKAVQRFKGKNWKKIAECFKDRTDVQCLHRWQKVLNPELVKGPWTKEEDEELIQLVEEFGPKKWSTIAQRLTGRIGKQCRERWHNHLNPAINKEAWTQEEELILIQAHRVYGNKWAELTKFLPGRTDNAIKNHWNSSVKKKLDAYLASGMLSQLSGLPCSHTNQSTPTSSRTQQGSGDVEAEEISECSQPSSLVRCSQSNSEDMSKAAATIVYIGDDNTNHPCSLGEQNDWVTSSDGGKPSSNELRNHPSSVDIDLSGESEFMLHCIDVDENQEAATNLIQTCADVSTSLENDVGLDMTAQVLTSEGDIRHPDGSSDVLLYQQFNFQIPPLNSQSYFSDTQFPSGTLESESNQFNRLSVRNQHIVNSSSNSHFFDNQFNVGALDQNDQVTDPVFTDVLSPGKVNSTQFHPISADENLHNQQEKGLLFYEPPCFPSLDIPFLSCDLIQSGGDLQHEYSPLGIRQLMMMTSINYFSPCRLWDSPSLDDTPEAVLKTAAKTFTCTPSILKKRNRDLLSPLSERPSEKKKERVSFGSAKHLFQQEEVMFEDKENFHPDHEMVQKDAFKSSAVKVQQPPGVFVEQKIDLFFSPDNIAMKSAPPNATTPRRISSEATENRVMVTCENPCQSLVSPLNLSGKKNKAFENPFTNENAGMFGETPLLKSLESPSAWKSPWSSFVPGPRVDTDITIEDIGYFTSPVERRSCYDALGLMKQLSEHTASAYTNALKVLGDETPDSLLKKRFSEKREKIHQQGSSSILSERRVLDFSECGSPRKGEQSARPSSGVSFSSPSSYLLKGCR